MIERKTKKRVSFLRLPACVLELKTNNRTVEYAVNPNDPAERVNPYLLAKEMVRMGYNYSWAMDVISQVATGSLRSVSGKSGKPFTLRRSPKSIGRGLDGFMKSVDERIANSPRPVVENGCYRIGGHNG